MNPAALLTLVIGVAAICLGAWGRFTAAGRARFDEMAGIIPVFAWYGGIGLLLVSACLWLTIWLRK